MDAGQRTRAGWRRPLAQVELERDPLLSFYCCSAYSLQGRERLRSSGDVTGVGC